MEFISDLVSFIALKGRWRDIIVLNVHAPSEDKDDDIKDSFYEEIERLFDQLPMYHMDIRTIERNADVLLNAFKDIGLAVNIGKTKYMEIGRHRGMIPNAHVKIGSNSHKKVNT